MNGRELTWFLRWRESLQRRYEYVGAALPLYSVADDFRCTSSIWGTNDCIVMVPIIVEIVKMNVVLFLESNSYCSNSLSKLEVIVVLALQILEQYILKLYS